MSEEYVTNVVAKYYPRKNISKVKILDNRIIIEFKNISENPELSKRVKEELFSLYVNKKISMAFIEEKNSNISTQAIAKWNIKNVKKIIGVASGKGGVGKSTTSVNLALALANQGKKVALVDADIYGPSIPTMLGYEGQPITSDDKETFNPFCDFGIESISIGALIDKTTPLIWRGSKACGAIEQLITQTKWNDIDIMVIDMPPGTGDIQITLSQHIDFDGIVIVSTPQDIALIDAIKGVNMFKKTGSPILGIIENMSYFICPNCGNKADIFGSDGAKQIADNLNEVFLGEIPLHIEIRKNADNGTPIVATSPDSPYTKAYEDIAKKIIQRLG